jgi:hypothetical protein
MPKPPRGFARVCGGCSGSRHGMGSSVQRSSPEHQGWGLRPGMRARCRSKLNRAVSAAIGGFALAGQTRGRRQNAGSRRPDDISRHSLWKPAQKNQEAKVTLTKGLRRTRTQHRVAGDEDRRRRQGGAHGGTAAEVIGAFGLRRLVRGAPVEVARGLRRPETHRRRGIALRRGTYRRRINGGGTFQSKRWRAVQRLGVRWEAAAD